MAQAVQAGGRVALSPSPAVTLVAWAAIVPASILVEIIWRVVLGAEPPSWLGLAKLGVILALLAIACTWRALRPLRGFLVAVTALDVGSLIGGLIERSVAWTPWARQAPSYEFVFADSLVELIPCLLLALTLVGSGLGRRHVFLVKGDLGAPSRMPFRMPPISWRWLGPIATAFFAGPLALQLLETVRPDLHMFHRALAGLPRALAFAAINAAQEEVRSHGGSDGRRRRLHLVEEHAGAYRCALARFPQAVPVQDHMEWREGAKSWQVLGLPADWPG